MKNKYLVFAAALVFCLIATTAWAQYGPQFIRGDMNNDGVIDITDQLAVAGGPPFACEYAADVNDDGIVGDAADVAYIAAYRMGGGPAPPPPYPDCGPDPTPPIILGTSCGSCPPAIEAPVGERVPTMSEAGTLVLLLMLMGTAFWILRRRGMATSGR